MTNMSKLQSELKDEVDFDSIALKSEFYEWSCEYFREPQMAVTPFYSRLPRLMILEVLNTMKDNGENSAKSRSLMKPLKKYLIQVHMAYPRLS